MEPLRSTDLKIDLLVAAGGARKFSEWHDLCRDKGPNDRRSSEPLVRGKIALSLSLSVYLSISYLSIYCHQSIFLSISYLFPSIYLSIYLSLSPSPSNGYLYPYLLSQKSLFVFLSTTSLP